MANLYLYWLVLLIAVIANCAEIGDIVEPEEIDPLIVLDEANDKQRDERAIFDFLKKPKPVAEPKSDTYDYSHTKTAYGFKTGNSGYGSGGGYGSSGGYGSYGTSSRGFGYGHHHGHKHGWGNSISGADSNDYLQNILNQGQSTSQRTMDFLLNARKQLPMFGDCPVYLLPANVLYSCQNNQCQVSCPSMYTFPDGKTSLKLVCIGKNWTVRDSAYLEVPPCQAICNPPCQNNGICIEPGQCRCSENFLGPFCQYKRAGCASSPPRIKNSNSTCANNVCNSMCREGYQFPDGSKITNIECQNGQWIHTKSGQHKPPDCEPICNPPCENGGMCRAPNVCECPRLQRGNRCQYSLSACNHTMINFYGNVNCSYGSDLAKCTFSCVEVPGLKVEGRLDIVYECEYSEGEYKPSPTPKCIYPPGYTIRAGSKSSQYKENKRKIITTGGGSHSQQYMTDHERIVAILAKFKEHDFRNEMWSSEEDIISPSSFSLYMTDTVDLFMDQTPKPAFCTTWGGNNMKTFDGLVFKAPLSCSHTLINDMQDATFDITMKACPYGSGYGCSHTLKIYWQSVLYTFDNQNGTVHLYTPNKKLPIPVQVMGMKVIPVARNLQIELESVGLQIDWDRHQYVGIQAGAGLWNRVGGLCGSLDGDYKNDLMTKMGVKVETVKSFTDSWRVQDSSDLCVMENSAELEFDSKSCEPEKHKKAFNVCERLLANEKLEECIKSFNFAALLKTCIDDYCNCNNREHPETCNCDALHMLAKECAFRGVKLEHGWRNLEICPISCNNARVYLPCGPDVEPTCESAVLPTKGKCTEGCFCPEGTVQYNDACINPELCPCTMGGKVFKSETIIRKQCNTCTCKNAQWKCTDEKCSARCGAIGDPHYQTFDGKRFDFMGKCSYFLLKTQKLSVEAENVACSGEISENLKFAAAEDPSCTKSVTINFMQKNGVPTSIKLEQGMATHINGKELLKFPKILGSGEVLIRHASSSFITVEFPDGIKVWWDGVSRVYIDAPPSYRDKTAGLCGTFNSNTQDDFLTPEGDIETAVEPFADKWRTKDTCDFLAQTPLTPHPCTAHPERRKDAEKYCAWIMEDTFQDCHWTVEPEQYYEDCLYDVCACEGDLSKCFCPILSAYGSECVRQGIKTGWRMAVKECAVKCPIGQVYDECGDSCVHSCEDLAARKTCKKECVEGCRCPKGQYLNENNECVPQNKCHCTYDGITFKPGYKEVRPGSKYLDLCTCLNGVWDCEEAEAGDDVKYPPSSELRAECANRPYADFSQCVAKEPKTCKNMHDYKQDLDECVPGCQCMVDYVYDTGLKMCVLPEKCSCHHGGKSYNDGEKIKEDCNTCVCEAGKWLCSQNGCESTCSVWGDSHFTTFDKYDFDFQGACDYVLAKGVANNGDGFAITIQNVLCGTMGVTCSKSVEISLTGSIQDTLTLASDASYLEDANKSVMNKLRDNINSKSHGAFHVYKAGVFVVIEVLPLHLQLKWDEGTRVYVKLGNEWKNNVSGLCGNYNDNAMDDMQTPSQALETSPLIFGHSWRVQQFCEVPKKPIDACKEHPQRETWAQLKCGLLKSNIFKECHAEVPVEMYLKRCIFDTCACDQGGDCECLCTAVAAYSHACSQKGINIRWRTPHFCPMQCDPHCSEYKSCTPACAVETCDNFLDQSFGEHMCKTENCIEGCDIKPCDKGMIYLNDSYKECVPKSECKPICMVRDGKTYYEGEITYQDECATCRCSKKKEVCSGVKCAGEVTTTAPIVEGTTVIIPGDQNQSKCLKGWTRWFDADHDASGKVVRLNDDESLPRYDHQERVFGSCKKQFMKKIECRVVDTHEPSDLMDENVSCNLQDGLACIGECHDYELRVFCECKEEPTTTPSPTEKPEIGLACDNVMAEYKEYPGDCHKFLHCQPKSNGDWHYVEKTCGETMMFNPIMNVCDHIYTVQGIKPICQGNKSEKLVYCPEGQIMSECANQCEHTCHYYAASLRWRGLCQPGEHCKSGCVDKKRPDCPSLGKYWRDENTCVEMDQCPCMDKSEKYVQPHMPFLREWEVCQCIDNDYTCIPNKLEETTITPPPPFKNITDSGIVILPVTVTPPQQCNPKLMVPVIEAEQPLPNEVFSASSTLGPKYLPHFARLSQSSKDKTGAWSPMINDQMQYLQITLPEPEPLFGVVVAGSTDFDNYVTLFKILYSHDGETYHYLVDETGKPQMFNGHLDSRPAIKTLFNIPIEAKYIRLYPLKWHNSIALRVELLGCGLPETTTTTTTTPASVTQGPRMITPSTEPPFSKQAELQCTDEMGVENGKMSPNQVKASSVWQLPKPAKKPKLIDLLKLSSPVGWRPVLNGPNEYIQFDFLEPRNISGFITKGGPDGWVTGYKVAFAKTKLIWNNVLDGKGHPKVFPANHDQNTVQHTYFNTPILTQYLKIWPVKWEENINMRVEPLGCFESYPEIKEEIKEVLTLAKQCLACNGQTDTLDSQGKCKCENGLFWNGSSCIQSNLCPCVENYISYPIGSKFENKDCEECVCILGGHPSCKAKKCPPCEGKDLRPIVGPGCYCKCAPCPKYQKLCPSSGDCIPEDLWCNGIRDCADDEDATCSDTILVPTQPKIQANKTMVVTCPVPECPPKMKMKITEKKIRQMSSMFISNFNKRVTVSNDGKKITKTKVITESTEYLDTPQDSYENQQEDECEEFTCVPIPDVVEHKNASFTCTEPKCPANYMIELDMSSAKANECPNYACVLKPRKDDVCEISGKMFTTFDGTEFKYDTCSHILARDLVNSSWIVSVHLQCTDETRKLCRKAITVEDREKPAKLIIMPNMRVNFNGFEYSVSQLINSPICKASFVISQPGNTVLVVSPKRGFWVLYDDIGYIKVGISSKFIKTVDGLCGYYDGIAGNDKRAPDGTIMTNTMKFGDSWFDQKTPKDKCYAQTCPLVLQKKALALCNTIKHPTFLKCGKSVNYKQFVSKCMETTCECLKANNGDASTCKCNILQDFVKKCLTVNPNVQLATWRAVHQCEISCPAPLVHSDCYKRRCEPSCDTLNSDDCPVIEDACFSGCYCPEGSVRKGETCVPIAECKDCVCNTIGTTKYFTYDRNKFTFNGNCTYLLSRDIVLPGVHTFQVYVSMDDCHKLGKLSAPEHSSCAKALHILNGDHIIHIQRMPNNSKALQTFVDGIEIKKMPYKDTWINLKEIPGKEFRLNLPEAHVELKAALEDLVFSIGVPSVKYGSKMEGLCGDCDGNPNNDMQQNPAQKNKKPSKELVDIIDSWKADEPKLGLHPNECLSESEVESDCVPLPPEKDPCMILFNEGLFGKCNMIVDPLPYISSCQQDICKPGNTEKGACETLAAYAKECAAQGICLNWRSPDLCPYDCPSDMIYESCGCQKSCETLETLNQFQAVNMKTNTFVNTLSTEELCPQTERYEGCFCSAGKVMEKGRCISEELCVKCEDADHMPGERWQKDNCTECLCDKSGRTKCVERNCLIEENICAEGYTPQKKITDDLCCPRYICVPEPKLPPAKTCLEPLMPICGPGQFKKQKTGPDGCLQYICECKPKEECEALLPPALKPGEKLVQIEEGCCPTQKIVCDTSTCPAKPESCVEEFYEVFMQQQPLDCCPTYYCAPPKDVCIVEYMPNKKFTKKLAEKWQHPTDPCKLEQCVYGPNDSLQISTLTETCDTKCSSGFEYVNKNLSKCCGECVQTQCVFEGELFEPLQEWKSADNCTSYTCSKKNDILLVVSNTETCPDVSSCPEHLLMPKEGSCCKFCKVEPTKEDLTNCLPISLAEAETEHMVKILHEEHGYCKNKQPIQGYTECSGACNSGSKFNAKTLGQDKVCHCCNIKSYKQIIVPLICEDDFKIERELEIPASCGCQPCFDSVEYLGKHTRYPQSIAEFIRR